MLTTMRSRGRPVTVLLLGVVCLLCADVIDAWRPARLTSARVAATSRRIRGEVSLSSLGPVPKQTWWSDPVSTQRALDPKAAGVADTSSSSKSKPFWGAWGLRGNGKKGLQRLLLSAALPVMAGLSPFMALSGAPQPAMAADPVKVAGCLFKNCQLELGRCILDPNCFANIICINTCNGRPDETECQIECGNLYENEVVGQFNACALSQKKCVDQKPDDGSYPVPPDTAVTNTFDINEFTGKWYISAGLNPLFDIFDCQVHFFNIQNDKVYAKLNWRITEPDGEFFTRNAIQRFVQDKQHPGILYNHDNEYLHYQDDWYILDHEPNEFIAIYYRGRNDAWVGYGGAVVYTRSPTVPEQYRARIKDAFAKANVDYGKFRETDNTCQDLSVSPTVLRAEFAKKLFISEEQQLQEALTAARFTATNEIVTKEKGAKKAIGEFEKAILGAEKSLQKEIVNVEKKVEQEIERDVKKIEEALVEESQELGELIQTDVWKIQNQGKLDSLAKKLKNLEMPKVARMASGADWGQVNEQTEVRLTETPWMPSFGADQRTQDIRVMERLLAELESAVRESGAYINRPLTLSADKLEMLVRGLDEHLGSGVGRGSRAHTEADLPKATEGAAEIPAADKNTTWTAGIMNLRKQMKRGRSSTLEPLPAVSTVQDHERQQGGRKAEEERLRVATLVRRLQQHLKVVNFLRVIEKDKRATHVCDVSLLPSLQILDLDGCPPSFVRSMSALRGQMKKLRLRRSALCTISDLLNGAMDAGVEGVGGAMAEKGEAEGKSEDGQVGAFRRKGAVAQWSSLEHLAVNDCELPEVKEGDMRGLCRLGHLELQHNSLVEVSGLQDLPGTVQYMDLSFNVLRSVAMFAQCQWAVSLQVLFLRSNELRSTRGLEALASLRRLDLALNRLTRWDEIQRLSALHHLESLWLTDNPLTQIQGYRLKVFALIAPEEFIYGAQLRLSSDRPPRIVILDGEPPSREETHELRRRMFLPPGGDVPVQFTMHSPARLLTTASLPGACQPSAVRPLAAWSTSMAVGGVRGLDRAMSADANVQGGGRESGGAQTRRVRPASEEEQGWMLDGGAQSLRLSKEGCGAAAVGGGDVAAASQVDVAKSEENRWVAEQAKQQEKEEGGASWSPSQSDPARDKRNESRLRVGVLDMLEADAKVHQGMMQMSLSHDRQHADHMPSTPTAHAPAGGLRSVAAAGGGGFGDGGAFTPSPSSSSRQPSLSAPAAYHRDMHSSATSSPMLTSAAISTVTSPASTPVKKKQKKRRKSTSSTSKGLRMRVAQIEEDGAEDDFSVSLASSSAALDADERASINSIDRYDHHSVNSPRGSLSMDDGGSVVSDVSRPLSQGYPSAAVSSPAASRPHHAPPTDLHTTARPSSTSSSSSIIAAEEARVASLRCELQELERRLAVAKAEMERVEVHAAAAAPATPGGAPAVCDAVGNEGVRQQGRTGKDPEQQSKLSETDDKAEAHAEEGASGGPMGADGINTVEAKATPTRTRPMKHPSPPASPAPSETTTATAASLDHVESARDSLSPSVVTSQLQVPTHVYNQPGGASEVYGGPESDGDSPRTSLAHTSRTVSPAIESARGGVRGYVGSPELAKRPLLDDVETLRLYLTEQQVFEGVGAAGCAEVFQVDPSRTVYQSLDMYFPEKLLFVYKEPVLADVRYKGGRIVDLLPTETTVLLAVTDLNVYIFDVSFASSTSRGSSSIQTFDNAPRPLLLGRHPVRNLDRVVLGFKGHWGRLEFGLSDPPPSPTPAVVSMSPTAAKLHERYSRREQQQQQQSLRGCRLVEGAVAVGYTIVTRSKAKTMEIINRDIRPLANESRLSGRMAPGRPLKSKADIVNREDDTLRMLADLGLDAELRYYEMVFQWWKKRADIVLPRTVVVTRHDLVILVEDFRESIADTNSGAHISSPYPSSSPASPLKLTAKKISQFSARPAAGERVSVLLHVSLKEVVGVTEDDRDPRKITITVREKGLFTRSHTWRIFSRNRKQIDGLVKILRAETGTSAWPAALGQ